MSNDITTSTPTDGGEDDLPFWQEYRLQLSIGILAFLITILVLLVIACVLTRRKKRRRAAASKEVAHDTAVPVSRGNDYTPSPTAPHPHRQNSKDTLAIVMEDMAKQATIDQRRLELRDIIGHGSFGNVYKGVLLDQNMQNPRIVAVKTVNDDSSSRQGIEKFVKEAMLMKGFRHKNVLSMIAITFKNELPYVILPFMENGDLRTYLGRDDKTFTVKDLLQFAVQVAEGMACLADNQYVHRDLACRNCLVDKNRVVKIADFGLVRDLHSDDYYIIQDLSTPLPIKWMALESITQKKFSLRTDVWAFGVVLWEIMTRGQKPYPGLDNSQVIKFLKEGKRMAAPPRCPSEAYNLMLRCWRTESADRPSFKRIVKDLSDILKKGKQDRTSKNVKDYYTEPVQSNTRGKRRK